MASRPSGQAPDLMESHYSCTFAGFLEIPRLRPEEAFYFAENALKALVQLKDEFPHLPLQKVRAALENQNGIANERKRSNDKNVFHNITEGVINNTRAVLRDEAKSAAPDAASEDLTHTEEHVGAGEYADAGEHIVVAMEPAATEAAATDAAEAAVVAEDDVDNSDSSQCSLFNERSRNRKRADSVVDIQNTTT
ncbi:hypothetical protein BKA80DRAFT_307714 [Phyllosticta citrichinensis]